MRTSGSSRRSSRRARFRCVDGATGTLLERLGISAADVEQPRDELLARIARHAPDDAATELQALSDGLQHKLSAFEGEPALAKAARRTRATISRAVARLIARHRRALVERDQIASRRIDRLQAFLFPGGTPQERVYGLPWFAARLGLDAFKAAVFAAITKEPFATNVRDLRP